MNNTHLTFKRLLYSSSRFQMIRNDGLKNSVTSLNTIASGLVSVASSSLARKSSSLSSTPPSPLVQQSIRNAEAFCFDVDSTVITTEGIDELASYKGCLEQVAALTRSAMGGQVPFRDALSSRLSLINPSQNDMVDFLAKHPFVFTPGMESVIKTLQRRGVDVFLVSGGFTQMIIPIAKRLSIPVDRVYANTILFDEKGAYRGFDLNAPTSKDGGKTDVIRNLRRTLGYKEVVMVGDGATDLQARTSDAATAFIGYGGIAERKVVREGADWYIHDLNVLDEQLKLS